MRRIKEKENLLKSPLNFIFGQGEAAVRVLRVLSTFQGIQLAISEIAHRTGLTVPGVRRVLESLKVSGIITESPSGVRAYQLSPSHPITSILSEMFSAESENWENTKERIKEAFKEFPFVASLWIDKDYFLPGEPLNIYFVAPPHLAMEVKNSAIEKLVDLEKNLDISLRVKAVLREEVKKDGEQLSGKFELLHGIPPTAFVKTQGDGKAKGPRTNDEQKAQSLELSREAARMISENPSLIHDVKKKLDAQIEKASPSTLKELKKWKRLLDGASLHRLKSVMTEESEEADRMRQSSPFIYLSKKG